ncbi:9972_t:CDS:2 [Entrophospora sp. SA101]|nr:911_t:CDS:2 [Entrophospora sp. SA101]CAJ0638924.1 3702_t:CDS:2 [Entrophospora sp. SA101]CAJ0642015.1 9972_t:CDS:2 [Entrophospora sp. SA101]CAJ0823688.1 14293_t:CDS:2 [Entrophospora sp. SA101]CAJ0826260.1 17069_t:CDS:2 [Entrophospora sp. SA101]
MTAKFKELTKRYGTSALAVYFIISTIDLGTTFILIQSGGAERVKRIEDWCIENFGAYGIHKLLLPLRLGLTAAITPSVVKKLRNMGWNIGKSI